MAWNLSPIVWELGLGFAAKPGEFQPHSFKFMNLYWLYVFHVVQILVVVDAL